VSVAALGHSLLTTPSSLPPRPGLRMSASAHLIGGTRPSPREHPDQCCLVHGGGEWMLWVSSGWTAAPTRSPTPNVYGQTAHRDRGARGSGRAVDLAAPRLGALPGVGRRTAASFCKLGVERVAVAHSADGL